MRTVRLSEERLRTVCPRPRPLKHPCSTEPLVLHTARGVSEGSRPVLPCPRASHSLASKQQLGTLLSRPGPSRMRRYCHSNLLRCHPSHFHSVVCRFQGVPWRAAVPWVHLPASTQREFVLATKVVLDNAAPPERSRGKHSMNRWGWGYIHTVYVPIGWRGHVGPSERAPLPQRPFLFFLTGLHFQRSVAPLLYSASAHSCCGDACCCCGGHRV